MSLADGQSVKWFGSILWCIAGLYSAGCGLYVMAAYVSGLPVAWWSSLLVAAWVVSSGCLFLAGLVLPFFSRAAVFMSLYGSAILMILFGWLLASSARDYFNSVRSNAGFQLNLERVLMGLIFPFLLVLGSIVLAFTMWRRAHDGTNL